ncbi:MAG: hypothetical protein HY716_16670 [Planctomycetes bacterium]|nr:hypothetical protein [Planctomycetota bacterium]
MNGHRAAARVFIFMVAAVLLLGFGPCRKKRKSSGPLAASTCTESYAPVGSSPPVVITVQVGISEDVPMAQMQALYTRFVAANASLWNVTEGQVRIGHIRISDRAQPGTTSDAWEQLDLSGHDILVWPRSRWQGPGAGFVVVGAGRCGRFMGIPLDIENETLVHEFGHFLFQLSWTAGPILVDEYETEPDDSACIQELTFIPLRWCWTDNHLTQESQPRSCWEQILIDYPGFTYSSLNVAAAPPPDPTVEYVDMP